MPHVPLEVIIGRRAPQPVLSSPTVSEGSIPVDQQLLLFDNLKTDNSAINMKSESSLSDANNSELPKFLNGAPTGAIDAVCFI